MSTLLGRTAFLEDTASLFADEKTVNARSKIIEWLNGTAVGTPQKKCDALAKIQEILLGSCIELLEEFIENIISMAHDPSQEVKKAVVGFIEQVCKEKIENLPRVASILSMLLRDSSPQVIKRVIQACASVYKNGLQWICTIPDITDSIEHAWNTLCLMKAQILDMIDHDNDGIRTNSIKFLEGVVILQTYPDEDSMKREKDFSLEDIPLTLKIVRRRKLEDESMDIFDCLLKFHAAVHISSVNLIACTGSLCTIAKMRPSLMNNVIKSIEHLHSNLPPTLTDSQVSSVRKNLKMQLINLLKNRGSFEMLTTIVDLVKDLGATQQEIMRAIPKMDKTEIQRRTKRAQENASVQASKKQKIGKEKSIVPRQMEIDYDELEEQKHKSTKINEKFLTENLKKVDIVVDLVIESIKNLPDEAPIQFLKTYKPFRDMTLNQQISKISNLLGEQMSEDKIGPGSSAFTKEPPMKPSVSIEEEQLIIQSAARKEKDGEDFNEEMEVDEEDKETDEYHKKEEATKKLRETIERQKGEQAMIARMKQRAKTLKLQEVTKPLNRLTKENFLLDAVRRILRAERHCIIGGVSAKRRKILTVMAATFPEKVREIIFEFIMEDIKNRLDLAFSWLYEEYCLLQGFTRHSYVKSEHSPDYAYNFLLGQLINGICESCDFKDKIKLLRRIFLESPLLSDEAINKLIQMCETTETSYHCFELIRDLAIRRPPRKQKFIKILLTYCVHQNLELREKSLKNIIILYSEHKILANKIEEFAIQWLEFLESETPNPLIFNVDYGREEPAKTWTEDLAKLCLNLFLALLPHNQDLLQNLTRVYSVTSADLKRTILRSIDTAIRKIGPESKQILNLIEICPKGVETLITRIIYILTERAVPTEELVMKVRELYQTKVNDVRLLIPVMAGLTKKEIITALPKFIKLNPIVVKEVFNRLFGIGSEFSNQDLPVTPSEILVALHNLDPAKCELKFIVKATSLCLSEKDVYTQDILASCLQQLVEIYPLPTLLMRTVIQSLTLYPRLAPFVVNLLQRLILKQVWKQKVIWDGFLKCCQRLKPQSLPVLLQLPSSQLLDALSQCPDLREPLLEYAQNITENQIGHISQVTMDILMGITQDVFVTDESGGYISLENIKKEIDEPLDSIIVPLPPSTDGQPLPPGEE